MAKKKKGKKGKAKPEYAKGSMVKAADMGDAMQKDAIECVQYALTKLNKEQDIAAFVKKEFDKKYGPTWHCVAGRQFGSRVSYEMRSFIHFFVDHLAILLFKC